MPYSEKQNLQHFDFLIKQVKDRIYNKILNLDMECYKSSEPLEFEYRFEGKKMTPAIGDVWGGLWDCGWFHIVAQAPEDIEISKIKVLIDLGGEGCVYDKNGTPLQGITNGMSVFDRSLGNPGKKIVDLSSHNVDLWIDAGCNDLFGVSSNEHQYEIGKIMQAGVVLYNEDMENLYYDMEVSLDLLNVIPKGKAQYKSIMNTFCQVDNVLIDYKSSEVDKARELLKIELSKGTGDCDLTISAIGHAHIDLAWFWPLRETKRKTLRTLSTMLHLMERFPKYKFGVSQPQQLQWIKEEHPLLFARLKKLVESERVEIQGGMWVESDCNLISGESMVRQILYGKEFVQKEFDKDMEIMWLPDAFGYSGAMPQIMKKSGIKYFMTTKLFYNQYNQFPHKSFWWEGIDGSKVLCHMPPEGCYNSPTTPSVINYIEESDPDNGITKNALMLFGIGDGGGGPGVEHLMRLKRIENLNPLPKIKQERAIDFFKNLDNYSHYLKKWVGEIYFERHQGTYTSIAKMKYYNRKMEFLLKKFELLNVINMLNGGGYFDVDDIWKEVLLLQFHDILPGTSINRVYDEAFTSYEKLIKYLGELEEKFIQSSDINIVNTLNWQRCQFEKIYDSWVRLYSSGLGVSKFETVDFNNNELKCGKQFLENAKIRATFNDEGFLTSLFDKKLDKEFILSPSNQICVYDDSDGNTWDFYADYDEKCIGQFNLTATYCHIDGPFAIMEQSYQYKDSRLIQKIKLAVDDQKLVFETFCNFREEKRMVRAFFDFNLMANYATCDIAFGSIKRDIHRNTTIDLAKNEVSAHKWVDFSDSFCGVSLINDCKYGHKLLDNTVSLNLIRTANYPSFGVDVGEHKFSYALYTHDGNFATGKIENVAAEFNEPLSLCRVMAHDIIKLSSTRIKISAVKKAQDGNGIIIRMSEITGATVDVEIIDIIDNKGIYLVDLTEKNVLGQIESSIKFKAYEIITIEIII